MKSIRRRLAPIAILTMGVGLSGCGSTGPNLNRNSEFLTVQTPPDGDSVTTFFALGDWGTGWEEEYQVAEALKQQVHGLDSTRVVSPFVVGLGDNVYPNGLKVGWGSETTDMLLEETFGLPFSDLQWKGKPLDFHTVPGNHDYAYGMTTSKRSSGYGDVIHQETTAEGRYAGFHYYPLNYPGKPDTNDEAEYDDIAEKSGLNGVVGLLPESMTLPEKVDVPDGAPVTIIAMDTPAMIERRKTQDDPANQASWRALDSLLAASNDPWKFVIGHHPILTYSSHGTYRTWDNWLWTGSGGRVGKSLNEQRLVLLFSGAAIGALISPVGWVLSGLALAVPALSVVGDEVVKHRQDLDHWAYRSFADSLGDILARYDAIYLSGHDHSLQLIEVENGVIQIISGAASKSNWVAKSAPGLVYSSSDNGFARLDVTDSTLWLRFCRIDKEGGPPDCDPTFEFNRSRGADASTE